MYFGEQIRSVSNEIRMEPYQIKTLGGFECDTSSVSAAASIFEVC
jgi:hypothetical protein